MKKRIVTLGLALLMMLSLAVPAGAAQVDAEKITKIGSEAVLINNETGERIAIKASLVSVEMRSYSENEEVEVGYEVFVPIPESKARDTAIGGLDKNGVKAVINVTYTISSDKEQIKISRISGTWTPSSNLYYLSDRSVFLTGGLDGPEMTRYPTGNSFSYNTGWGYHNFVTGVTYSPYANANAIIHVTGMTATYTLSAGFYFPDDRS